MNEFARFALTYGTDYLTRRKSEAAPAGKTEAGRTTAYSSVGPSWALFATGASSSSQSCVILCALCREIGITPLPRNPMSGYQPPREVNLSRRRVYYEDHLALLEVAPAIVRDYLILLETLGWRTAAIASLRVDDYDPERTETRPHGRLLKRGETDKVGVERWTIIPAESREAIERRLPGKRGWLFPAPKSKGHWSRHYAHSLVKQAWEDAELPEERWPGLHGWRRKWVDERDHLPDHVVAAQGAWLNPRTLDIYRTPSEEALLEVATVERKLRRNVQQNASGDESAATS